MLQIVFLLVKSTVICQKNEFIQRDLAHVLRQHMSVKEVKLKLVFSAIEPLSEQCSRAL